MNDKETIASTNRLLVKLRPTNALKAAESRVNLRPLYDTPQAKAALLGVGAEPQWFLADMPVPAENPWDLAHARVAMQLGISESDVIFVEPDIIHNVFRDPNEREVGQVFAVGDKCEGRGQDGDNGKARGPGFAWHLGDNYTQLKKARDAVEFKEPRTRIAHMDTGYDPAHCTKPEHIAHELERNFASDDRDSNSSEAPEKRRFLLDNYDHGTGTISILAGGKVPDYGGVYLGGAPGAEILPLRIAASVILLCTSSFARALDYAVLQNCDVVTLSMGGLPSRAWCEAVDKAYLGGLCMVAAAGNNMSGVPTRHIVYPARYGRVIAVCGVMADNHPYVGLKGLTTMEGNYGPQSRMNAALAAYTPNIPWACLGCKTTVRQNGEGTSAATPQVAAAVALWFEKYKNELPRDWQRIEAVRHALFTSAKNKKDDPEQLGNGILQAYAALSVKPVLGLKQTKADNDSFAFLRVITGLGVVSPTPREQMYNLEIAQRWMLNPALPKIVPEPEATKPLPEKALKEFMEAIIEDEGASRTLRKHVMSRYPVAARGPAPRKGIAKTVAGKERAFVRPEPAVNNPPYRRVRVYAVDPSFSTRLETAGVNEVTLKIHWETLKKGPVGEYLAVKDIDNMGNNYGAVDLDDPRLLAQDGWAPSEANPHFHQQMVYAVSMKTIGHFEQALGRPVLWRPMPNPKKPYDDSNFVKQLTVRPHAFRQANAYYSPQLVTLQFGYFDATADDPGDHMPGSRVYSCLSHDIIAHETTHAILDGMHRRFSEPSNPDVLALHEGFADIIALMQHFTIPEIIECEINRTRGDIEAESMLGSLAIQFGRANGGRGALRDAIGSNKDGVWQRFTPDPADYPKRVTPHARGAVLVAAVFDAFIAIYKERIADLLRIYTGGTGILPNGAIHPDLAYRLAQEAVKSAKHVLNICIRALDYLPPVDVTFFEYLRALITADIDLVADDRHDYRVAFVEAFRRRGIYPVNIDDPSPDTPRNLAVDTLRWEGLAWSNLSKRAKQNSGKFQVIVDELKHFSDACFYIKDRQKLFEETYKYRIILHKQLVDAFRAAPTFAREFGIDPEQKIEVHELRPVMRVSPDGRYVPQIIIALMQSKKVKKDRKNGTPEYEFRGGSTLVVDLSVPEVKYRIVKNINSESRQARTESFLRDAAADPLRALFLSVGEGEPFAALHALADDGL